MERPAYRERFRPRYHFTPVANWMNDPNGLVHFDGEFHLFYQFNPHGDRWGHMSWGHAVSRDLVRWEHLPVALGEEDGVMVFSGSAVVDWTDSSGFGAGGSPPLVAVYTAYREADGNQAQCLAYSTDRGRSWTRYAGNPVLDIGSTEFRDPRVFWYAPHRRWVMAVAMAAEHRIRFYASDDLKRWTHLSDFGPAGATGGVWECPDLFPLPVDGDPERTRWVLQVDLNPGGPVGGSGSQFFVGDFDGTTFTAESTDTRWVDHGADFYAAMSWSDAPPEDGRRIWMGWMSNWLYAQDVPTAPWRGAQSLPRRVRLREGGAGVVLVQEPVAELRRLRGASRTLPAMPIPEGTHPLGPYGIRGAALEIVAEIDPGTADECGLRVRVGAGEETLIGIEAGGRRVCVDRTRSGAGAFHPEFAARHAAPLPPGDGTVRLHLFVDHSSVELFAAGGEAVITDRIFPAPESDGVESYARGGTARLLSLQAWELGSAWDAEPTDR
jgi:fructan beta-fructosidase